MTELELYDRPRQYTAATLADFLNLVLMLGMHINGKRKQKQPLLWFRGHTHSNWNLLPSVFRSGNMLPNYKGTYSNLHLLEDYRYQNFRSRATHQLDSSTLNQVEWQEVMQHHFTPTRLMDWSESAITALAFALECFINPDKRQEHENALARATGSPNIWILDPQILNEHVYACMCYERSSRYPYIETALKSAIPNRSERIDVAGAIGRELSCHKLIYLSSPRHRQLNHIVSLATIASQCEVHLDQLLDKVKAFEINPFHYLVSRYYIDRLIIPIETPDDLRHLLPPIATIHPYHSTRIQTQKGAFTAVPYYKLGQHFAALKKIGTNVTAMEHQPLLADCLVNILLTDPERIADELKLIGIRETDLYPEIEKYSQFMEQED